MNDETDDDGYRTVRNEERGCGFLEPDKGYLRSPPASASGHLPAFVWFDPPVEYLERDKFRGYEFFPGVQFELAVTGGVGAEIGSRYDPTLGTPPEFRTPEEAEEEFRGQPARDGITSTDPSGEIHRHIARCVGTADGSHAGEITAFRSHDLYMHIGASYYGSPEEFVEEVRRQGLSKAIPVSESNPPPRINPGKTRLFLTHPNGTGDPSVADGEPAVIGYVYLHRTLYTETSSGEHPAWAKETARAREDFEPVHIGNRIYEDGTAATFEGGEWTEKPENETADDRTREESEAEAAIRTLPMRVVPSEEDGRDVRGVPLDETDDSGADEDSYEDEKETDGTEYIIADPETFETVAGPFEDYSTALQSASGDHYVEPLPRTELLSGSELVECPRPEECPDCSGAVGVESMATTDYGPVEVRVCRSCEWANNDAVNRRLTEIDLRGQDYNDLRTLSSSRGISLQNPNKEDLIDSLLDSMNGGTA
jgi:hypothetical protein